MAFDHYASQWFTTLHLPPGEHCYKYVIDGDTWVVNEEEPTTRDAQLNVNNLASI